MNKPLFQPAPRPRPLTAPEDAQSLAEASGDLGFTRPTTAKEKEKEGERATAPTPKTPKVQKPKAPLASERKSALKFDIPDELYVDLRREALARRVTVKYLVLEALAAKGYKIDLSSLPEDGRRLR